MLRPVKIVPKPTYKLYLRFEDGVEGEVDLSHLTGRGVFELWNEPGAFERVRIGQSGQIRWTEDIEICSDALYLQLTGQTADEAFCSIAPVAGDTRD